MSPMPRYRSWQLAAMEKNMLNIEHIVSTISDRGVFDKRDGGDGWTISEVLGHLADTDSYFLARARALAEGGEPPQSSGRSVDERVKEAGYAEQDAMELLQRWLKTSASYHEFLSTLPDDEELWERPGRDADGGGFTLNDQIILSAYHDLDHLHQIVKIIRGM